MNVSIQLYSARNFKPWESVIPDLARLGYRKVEGFGGNYDDPAAFRALLDEHGMTMPSGHFFPLDSFEEGLEATIIAARALGMNRLFCPAPTDDYRNGADAAAWTGLAKRLETAAKRVNDAGMRFGWHNHHWEFLPLAGGEVAMELLLEHAPSIEWEADIAWIVRGNADPLAWIARHGERMTTAHVKDVAPAGENLDEDGWADVGYGVMDWKAITAALRAAGTDLFVIEHDNPADLDRFARRSLKTMRAFVE